jgi:hypothetical protein
MKYAYLAILIMFTVGLFFAVRGYQSWKEGQQVYCTEDAKLCPDGSYVGRTGPKCEFKCPGE